MIFCAVAGGVLLSLAACGGGGVESGSPTSAATLTAEPVIQCSIGDAIAAAETDAPDPLASSLWHLKNTGQARGLAGEDINVEPAWALSLGAGVTVAIVDDAVEAGHPDLLKNFRLSDGLDYRGQAPASARAGSGLPCDEQDYHGTAVGGIIAARYKNGLGTAGVAPQASLVGFSALTGEDDMAVSDALNRGLQSVSIYNNSWGAPDTGELWSPGAGFAPAIERGLREGRAGKGAIYVFPAGNGGCALRDSAGQCQSELSTYDGYLAEPGLIVVGALDRFGKAPAYAESGANILVSAPGGDRNLGITTATLKGGYTDSFFGSSAAAPMVSGVVALMLSANPQLTWRDVRVILARTARRNDPGHASWLPASHSGAQAGRWYSPLYGFGAVDALAALKAAESWHTLGGSSSLLNCEVRLDPAASIPDTSAALTIALRLGVGCMLRSIEHVELEVDIGHAYSGDLDIRLISPSDSVSQLAQTRTCASSDRSEQSDRAVDDCGSYDAWRFASVRHLDESPQGIWHLELKDYVPGKAGTLRSVKLRIYGR